MNEDEKICPYCGGVIKKVAIKCKHCKALLEDNNHHNVNIKRTVPSTKLKKICKISIIILLSVLLTLSIVGFAINTLKDNNLTNKGYKSISVEIETDLNPAEIINAIATQEDDLITFLRRHKNKDDNSRLFAIFMDNMLAYQDEFNNLGSNVEALEKHGIITQQDTNFENYYYNEVIKVVNPKINVFVLFYNGAGMGFNDKYIYETYSPYLNQDWVEYLSLCLEYKKALYYAGYDGYKMNKVFNDYGEKLTVFLDKYPNFHLKSQVKKDIRAYKGF